jgi:hypothetical protein
MTRQERDLDFALAQRVQDQFGSAYGSVVQKQGIIGSQSGLELFSYVFYKQLLVWRPGENKGTGFTVQAKRGKNGLSLETNISPSFLDPSAAPRASVVS